MDNDQMQHDDDDVEVEYIDDSYDFEGDEDVSGDEANAGQHGLDEDGDSNGESVARIEPAREDGKTVFRDHQSSVLTVRLNGQGKLAITGGQDDIALCWDVYSGQRLFSGAGYSDSVTAVAYNIDSSLVAAADMNGLLQVWNVPKQQLTMRIALCEIEWITFHNREPRVLLCGHSDGTVTMWQIPKEGIVNTGNPDQVSSTASNEAESAPRNKTLFASNRSCCRGVLFGDGRRLAAAHDDGSVRVWNLSTTSQVHSWEKRDVTVVASGAKTGASKSEESEDDTTPTCMDVHNDDVLLAVGRDDGRVLLFHSQNGRLLTSFDCIARDSQTPSRVAPLSASSRATTSQNNASSENEDEDEQPSGSCESAVFIHSLDVLATGALDGTITLFDLKTSRVRSRWGQPDGARLSKLLTLSDAPHVVATTGLDAVVRLYDLRNQQVVRELCGHSAQILDADYSPISRLLVTSSDDHTARVFEPFSC